MFGKWLGENRSGRALAACDPGSDFLRPRRPEGCGLVWRLRLGRDDAVLNPDSSFPLRSRYWPFSQSSWVARSSLSASLLWFPAD
jgi:hypothetical protein